MAKGEDFVDVTKNEVTGEVEVFLSPEDRQIINNNPKGLTKEGCMVEVWQWSQSTCMPCLIRYLAMYKMCKVFTKSATLEDGSVILARWVKTSRQGLKKQMVWKEKIGKLNHLGEPIIMESVEELEKFVKERLHMLNLITAKGV